MSDDLSWLGRHLVLLKYKYLNDLIKSENYKPRPDLASFYEKENSIENLFWKFSDVGRYKCACDLLAYACHKRAGVWWVYQCILSLMQELKEKPDQEYDFSKVAESYDPVVPDFAKVEPPKPDPDKIAKMKEEVSKLTSMVDELKSLADPKIFAEVEEAKNYAFSIFEKEHGISVEKAIELAVQKDMEHQEIDENSPIFKAADELEQKLHTIKKETLETINAVLPPKVPEHEKQLSENALKAIYSWVVSPDEDNSKICLDVGNECADKPAGLLALTAFWAGGNLLPKTGDQVVPTPMGLAANGLVQSIMLCALAKGGTRKVKERYKLYFDIGVDVMSGQNTWYTSLEKGDIEDLSEIKENIENNKTEGQNEEKQEEVQKEKASYNRWKPQINGDKEDDENKEEEIKTSKAKKDFERWKPHFLKK